MKTFIKCECGAHGIGIEHEIIQVTKDSSIVETYLSYWVYGKWNMSLKERLRYCWHIIITGNVFSDMVCLNVIERKELITALMEADAFGDMAVRNYGMPE